MLYASKANSARDALRSRGVLVGEIQKDRQGTHFLEMQDMEDNGKPYRALRRLSWPTVPSTTLSIYRMIRCDQETAMMTP